MSRHRHPPARAARVAATAIAALALLALPGAAAAHAELDSITPADKATVDGPPSSIVAVFTEQLDPAKSSLALVDASGAVIAKGGTVDPNQTLTLNVDAAKIAPGVYTVRWTSASADDGDLDHGTTTFTVAAGPSAPPSAQPPASSAGPSAASSLPSIGPSPSTAPTTPASSTSDAVIPIVVALIVLAALGLWLLRGRARAGR